MIMDQPQLLCYFTRLAVDFVMPRLDIAALVDPNHTVNCQTSAPGFTRAGMGPSCDYCIDLAIRDSTHKEVKWSKELWICLLFFRRRKIALLLLSLMVLPTRKEMCCLPCVLCVTTQS